MTIKPYRDWGCLGVQNSCRADGIHTSPNRVFVHAEDRPIEVHDDTTCLRSANDSPHSEDD